MTLQELPQCDRYQKCMNFPRWLNIFTSESGTSVEWTKCPVLLCLVLEKFHCCRLLLCLNSVQYMYVLCVDMEVHTYVVQISSVSG